MASRSIATTCERALSHRILPAHQRITQPVAPRRHFHTPAPLFLDFLAPSSRRPLPPPRIPAARPPHPSRLPQRRSFSSTTPPRLAKAITNPRHDEEGNEMTITISPRAAHRLQLLSETDANPDLALRVSVESGGCHGFQYLMSLVNARDIDEAGDTLFEDEEPARKTGSGPGSGAGGGAWGGEYRAKVVMDEPSLELLRGSRIEYTMELIGSQFKVVGIPGAKSSCGCGTSFDVA
ncbi:hypothetical protein B0A55_06401 [Friedmanniomyces simplex]|uniref:Core domain-containing protein n=1 Tax=Friedmanniomyces simplex TaxID=329884 RepID=A0A4U0XK76_9PEZI|nr:hypothetical protein B0A55_06401 [Friedmanniomyces simplex]